MLSLTSVSASAVVIGDMTDEFKLPCQRVHAVTVTVCRRPDSNRRWLTPDLKATDLDHSATRLRLHLEGLCLIGGWVQKVEREARERLVKDNEKLVKDLEYNKICLDRYVSCFVFELHHLIVL